MRLCPWVGCQQWCACMALLPKVFSFVFECIVIWLVMSELRSLVSRCFTHLSYLELLLSVQCVFLKGICCKVHCFHVGLLEVCLILSDYCVRDSLAKWAIGSALVDICAVKCFSLPKRQLANDLTILLQLRHYFKGFIIWNNKKIRFSDLEKWHLFVSMLYYLYHTTEQVLWWCLDKGNIARHV